MSEWGACWTGMRLAGARGGPLARALARDPRLGASPSSRRLPGLL